MRVVFCPLLLCLSLFAQQSGVTAAWDVKTKMQALASDVSRLEDLLRRARPNEWIANGAPSAYLQQLESARNNMLVLIAGSEKLAKDPEKLTLALEVLFRMENMEVLLQSLEKAIRKYQGPSLADDIARFMADDSRHREVLRQHSLDLASTRENELSVVNAEAQRARTEMSRQCAPEVQPPARRVQRRSK